MKLFLDDERTLEQAFNYTLDTVYKDKWNIVRSYYEFVNFIDKFGLPDVISFDHDLGKDDNGFELSGYDCSKFLVNYCIDNNRKLPKIYVHSANTVGAENIRKYLENFTKHNKN
jgi:hypothetical protein